MATVTLNAATLTIDYIDDQTGSMVVTITANDNAGCTTTQDIFNIIVNAVNDPPNTVTDTLVVDEGGTVTTTTATNSSLLDNDTDVDDGQTLLACNWLVIHNLELLHGLGLERLPMCMTVRKPQAIVLPIVPLMDKIKAM